MGTSNGQCQFGPLTGVAEWGGPLLMLGNIHQDFTSPNAQVHKVLRALSLAVLEIKSKPQIVSLLGPSGVGKTSLLRIIAGLDKPSRGHVLISDVVTKAMRPVCVGDVGFVFQKNPLFNDRTVLENLVEPARLTGRLNAKEAQDKALFYLEKFGLIAHRSAWPAQLSGGQRQRVSILQQLITGKRFIVMDEPFSGLDPINITEVIETIFSIAYQHSFNTFIIATHDITSALLISDTVYLLGCERDEDNKLIPGARIKRRYNLIYEGLAYQPNAEYSPKFMEIRQQIALVDFPAL